MFHNNYCSVQFAWHVVSMTVKQFTDLPVCSLQIKALNTEKLPTVSDVLFYSQL